MSEDIFSKKENAFDALLEEFGVTEGVEAPPETTTNNFDDLFGTQPPAEPKKAEPTAEPKKAPNFDDLLADMPTKVEASPKSNDPDVPTKAEKSPKETPSLFDDLLANAKPAKQKKEKKEPEHIPDKSEDYRVPNDVLHLAKIPKPDNSWEAEAADIVVPEVKPKDTKGANPFGNATPSATPTKGANPFGNTTPGAAPTKGANPFGNTAPTKGATPTKGANPFGNTKGATPGAAPTKGTNPFDNATKGTNPFDKPTATPDNFNPFIKQEPTKEALWTSPSDLDYDRLAEKIAEKLIQKIAQKLK